jgi:chromosome segregation ATPase
MFKKLLLVAVVGVVAVAALKGTRFFGYAKNEVEEISAWVEDRMPVEKKIAHLRKEVKGLEKDVDRVAGELAREIVAVRDTAADLERESVALADEEKKVRAMAEKLKDATHQVTYGRETISIDLAKQRLSADVKRVVTRQKTVDTLRHTLAAREGIKDTLQKQMATLKTQKVALAAEIDALEAEYKDLQLKQMESRFQFDDTRLARIKESIRNLKNDIDVKKVKLELRPGVVEEPTGAPANGLSVDDILAPLNGKKADEKKLD